MPACIEKNCTKPGTNPDAEVDGPPNPAYPDGIDTCTFADDDVAPNGRYIAQTACGILCKEGYFQHAGKIYCVNGTLTMESENIVPYEEDYPCSPLPCPLPFIEQALGIN